MQPRTPPPTARYVSLESLFARKVPRAKVTVPSGERHSQASIALTILPHLESILVSLVVWCICAFSSGLGKYSASDGSSSCTWCPSGTYLADVGLDYALHNERSDCSGCVQGRFSKSDDRSSCLSWCVVVMRVECAVWRILTLLLFSPTGKYANLTKESCFNWLVPPASVHQTYAITQSHIPTTAPSSTGFYSPSAESAVL